MRAFLLAALATGTMAFTASADPVRLTDGQMDRVSAGVLDNNLINIPISVVPQISVPVSVNTATAIGVLAENISAWAQQGVTSGNIADLTNLLMAPQ